MSESAPQFNNLEHAMARANGEAGLRVSFSPEKKIYDTMMEDATIDVDGTQVGGADIRQGHEDIANYFNDTLEAEANGEHKTYTIKTEDGELRSTVRPIEELSNIELSKRWAEAEDAGDVTTAGDIQDLIAERISGNDRLSDQEGTQLLDNFIARKDSFRKKTTDAKKADEAKERFLKFEDAIARAKAARKSGSWTEHQKAMLEMGELGDGFEAASGTTITEEEADSIDQELDTVEDGRIKRVNKSEEDTLGSDTGKTTKTTERSTHGSSDSRSYRVGRKLGGAVRKVRRSKTSDRTDGSRVARGARKIKEGSKKAVRGASVKIAHPTTTKLGKRVAEWSKDSGEHSKGRKVATVVGATALAAGLGYGAYRFGQALGGESVPMPKAKGGNALGDFVSESVDKATKAAKAAKEIDPVQAKFLAGLNSRTNEVLEAAGKFPWNRAASLYGEKDATAHLLSATSKLQAQGVDVQWHGDPLTSRSAWISIDGISDTDAVWSRLSQTLAADDVENFLRSAQ